MPVELDATQITDRRSDFSPLSPPAEDPITNPDENDLLTRLIRSIQYIEEWMSEKKSEFNSQHEQNLLAIDTELDNEIKVAGGLNIPLDPSAADKTVREEKTLLWDHRSSALKGCRCSTNSCGHVAVRVRPMVV